jgi:hypothetical protein
MLLVPVVYLLLTGIVFADGNGASVSLDSLSSSQSNKPGANVRIMEKAPNIDQVTILVRNAGRDSICSIAFRHKWRFSTEFQLNDDAAEGQYMIRIGVKELTVLVGFIFKRKPKMD